MSVQKKVIDDKTVFIFDGTGLSREEFRDNFVDAFWPKPRHMHVKYVLEDLGLDIPQIKHLTQMLLEMVKNIYDHGNKKAVLEVWWVEKIFHFNFIDGNSEMINLTECKKNWTKKSENNFGHGTQIIKSHMEQIFDSYLIDDTSGGINYSGQIDYTKAKPPNF